MSESTNENTRREFMGTAGAATGLAALATMLGGAKAGAQTEALNAMGPTPQQIQKFTALPSDTPVVMVNLLKFKDAAEYQTYGVGVNKILNDIGAEMIFSGQCQSTLIGGAEWDAVALVRYPNAQTLIKMAQSPEYAKISGNREAGLEGQINLAVFEGDSFDAEAESEGVTADELMSQMDANGDGKIDMDEAPEQLKAAFGMVDADANGSINLEEAQTIADFINGQQ